MLKSLNKIAFIGLGNWNFTEPPFSLQFVPFSGYFLSFSVFSLFIVLILINALPQHTHTYAHTFRGQINEPSHDKTNKMACVPSEDSDQPGHPPSLIRVFAVRMKKAWVLSYPLSAQRRLWSDWADAQADLSLHWAHSHFVGFVEYSSCFTIICPPPFRRKAEGHCFRLSVVRGAWFRIFSRYLVPSSPPTVFGQSFWNFTGAFAMVWRFACGFFRILKLFFYHFFRIFNLRHFLSPNTTEVYRE